MNAMPSGLMAPHELIAIMTKRMLFGPKSSYWLRRE
jgi:hypothetical protein